MTDPSDNPQPTRWSGGSPWSDATAAYDDPARSDTAAGSGTPAPSAATAFVPTQAEPPTTFAAPPTLAAPSAPSASAWPPADPASVGYTPGSAAVTSPAYGYPAQSGPAYPVSGPGYPVSAPGYPVSAPGYPVSGPAFPVSGTVVPGGPAKPRRTAVVVLASLTALFLIAAGVLGGLYLTKTSAYNKQVNTVAARDATVTGQKKQIDDLQTQLKTTQDKLTDATQKATGSENQVTELTHEKQVISQCLDLVGQAENAANRGDRTTANKLLNQADPICKEADKYLN